MKFLGNRSKQKSSKSSKAGVGCLVLFALPFAAVGVFMAYRVATGLWDYSTMQSWRETDAWITHLELEEHRGDDSTTYQVVAEYDYEVLGREYHGDRVTVFSGSDNVGRFHEELHERLKPHLNSDQPTTAYFDPADPTASVLDRTLRWEMIIFHLAFVGAFGGAGFGMIAFAIYSMSRAKREQVLEESYPDKPWLQKPEWAEGVIQSSNNVAMYAALVFGLMWESISAPIAIMIFMDDDVPWFVPLIILAFNAVGVGILGFAGYKFLQLRKYGRSVFEMASNPGVIGGRLAGVILCPARINPDDDAYQLKLSCVRKHKSGDSTKETVVWSSERSITETLSRADDERTAIPVVFTIPFDEPQTEEFTGGSVSWKLSATAETPGIDYHSEFVVPVFRTEDSREEVTEDAVFEESPEAELPFEDLMRRDGLRVERSNHESLHLIIPPARHLAPALGASLMSLIFTGIGIGLLLFGGIFPGLIIGGATMLFSLLIVWFTLELWLRTSRIRIDGRYWSVRSSWSLWPTSPVEFESFDIARIAISGNKSSVGDKKLHTIEALLKDGRKVTLAPLIGERRVERALIQELERLKDAD
ncbi:DUF3592 domain-containing protein [Stratiformator vulcanicus]|uniref:DUF3592 domain-containing protein n=1 Tax=Stratiformator vulcanicus TaxID=2527980 RepID=A0A517QX40_9PLAN|nr:DUF3592 domain-containing protein [Stratiformator vulcanicus]QDT36153.1 hypothetical protein Pan189_05080 [Stratiformator vulcanicus]